MCIVPEPERHPAPVCPHTFDRVDVLLTGQRNYKTILPRSENDELARIKECSRKISASGRGLGLSKSTIGGESLTTQNHNIFTADWSPIRKSTHTEAHNKEKKNHVQKIGN
jgi:hypothetical protein